MTVYFPMSAVYGKRCACVGYRRPDGLQCCRLQKSTREISDDPLSFLFCRLLCRPSWLLPAVAYPGICDRGYV